MSYLRSRLMIQFAVLESSPVVGSSRNSREGEVMSSIPMLHLFLSPPDTPRRNSVPICTETHTQHVFLLISRASLSSQCDLHLFVIDKINKNRNFTSFCSPHKVNNHLVVKYEISRKTMCVTDKFVSACYKTKNFHSPK